MCNSELNFYSVQLNSFLCRKESFQKLYDGDKRAKNVYSNYIRVNGHHSANDNNGR